MLTYTCFVAKRHDTSADNLSSALDDTDAETGVLLPSSAGVMLVKRGSGGHTSSQSPDSVPSLVDLPRLGSDCDGTEGSSLLSSLDKATSLGDIDNTEAVESAGRDNSTDVSVTPLEMLFTRELYHVALCFFLTTAGGKRPRRQYNHSVKGVIVSTGLYIAGVFRTFGETHFNNDDSFLTSVGSFASLANTLGRVLWGSVGDRCGSMHTLVVMNVVFAFAFATYGLSFTFGKVS